MKAKITKLSLEKLSEELSVLSDLDQVIYSGGGDGTRSNPYTYEEYQQYLQSGTWMGGFVLGSEEHYHQDESGNWVCSNVSDSYFIPKDNILLKDVIVIGHRHYTSDVSGMYPDPYDPNYIGDQDYLGSGSGNWDGYTSTNENYSDNSSDHYGGGGNSPSESWSAQSRVHFVGFKDKTGCLRRCLEMMNLPPERTSKEVIQMVHDGGNGNAGNPTSDNRAGIALLNQQLQQGIPVVVGVDYHPEECPKEKRVNKDGITDHFVLIVSSEIMEIEGHATRIYRYYDPRTSNKDRGTSSKNYFYERDGRLIGRYGYPTSNYPEGIQYTVSQVRRYE